MLGNFFSNPKLDKTNHCRRERTLIKERILDSRIVLSVLILITALAMMLSFGSIIVHADDQNGNTTYYDGEYEGTAKGRNDGIVVKVTVRDGVISNIDLTANNETPSYWEQVKDILPARIIENQSTDVEGVSGATLSSDGIKAAVANALAKATVDPNGWYDSGEGTSKKPYIIKTAEQLAKFAAAVDEGEDLAGKFVALGSDIDLTGIDNWNPVGTEGASASSNKFAGSFDGQGHTITGMKITGEDYTSEINAGLFSTVDKSTIIKNLNMRDVNIDIKGTAVLRAGGIAGDTVNGSATEGTHFDRCSVTGTISADSGGTALVFAGGIAGRAMTWTKVSNSWTDVDTTAISRGGNNSGYAGGVFGMSGNNTLVVNTATSGDTCGSSPKSTNFGGMAGGIGGMLTCKAYNIYSTGNVTIGNGGTQHKWIGAIAGEFTSSGMTNDGGNYVYPETGAFRDYGYYANDITLTIEKYTGTEMTTEAADLRAAGTSSSMGTHDKIFDSRAVSMARADMTNQGFADTLNGNLKEVRKLLDTYGFNDVDICNWTVSEGKVLPVGKKWVNTEPDASIFAGGTGTAEDPYQIATENQLREFAASLSEGVDYDGYVIKVTHDIDISSGIWTPIGGQDYAFNGTFDGSGFTISGMKAGTEENPYEMSKDNPYMGFFGVLGKDAVIKNVKLTNVNIFATTPQYIYIGGIAAINDVGSDSRKAMIIDGCSVSGKITAVAEKSNAFVGGIIASQYKGAVINSRTDMDLKCTVRTGNAIAEVGGLVGMNNRGLVANSYTLGDVWGSASRNDGDEGMASTGNLVGVNAGDLVGSYSKGNNTTAEYSVYAGELTGWITGIGKVYSCYYNKEAIMTIDGRSVVPPADFGTKVAPGVNEEGDAYVGGIVDELTPYTSETYSAIAEGLNGKFTKYPIDTSIYGISGNALYNWKYDSDNNTVSFDKETEKASTTYVQPQAEIVPPDVEELHDGTWYGRDENKIVTVKITVKNGEVKGSPEVINGDGSNEEAVDAAVTRAKAKALYGDTTGYGAGKSVLFGGGKGTREEPYLISSEKQLRAIAESLNEDETFADVYFKQTADIDISSEEWLPIGYGILAKVKKTWTQVASYPFLGNYDGNSYTITGLRIGSDDNPSSDPRASFTAGLFGFISGDHYSNGKITDARISRIENVKLRNININVRSEGQNYAGGLLGNAQNGFIVDNCSVTGKLSSYSKDSFARGAGIAGNALRGSMLNCWSDVDITAETDAGNVYAGGLYALDNRVTTINSYSLGSVTGNAAANNKVHIGGLSGQCGGVHYNCYTSGDVISLKTTSDAGLAEGRLAGIAAVSKVYYNSDAKLIVAGTEKEHSGIGVSVPENPDVTAKTAEDLASQNFVDLLNENVEDAPEAMENLQEIINSQTDLEHTVQFSGNVKDLAEWTLSDMPVLKDNNIDSQANSARAEIEDIANSMDIDPELQEQAEKIKADTIKAIASASDAEEINNAVADGKAALEKLQQQSDKLVLLKKMAINELINKNVSDYSGENLDKLLDTLIAAQKKINKAKSNSEIEQIIKETKAAVSKIKTDAQIAAEKAKKNKKANTLTVKGKTVTIKYSKLKKKKQTVARGKLIAVSKAQGKVTYKKVSVGSKAINKKYGKKITINARTGKVTVAKGLKKGTYKVKTKVTAAGNNKYKALTKNVTFTIKVIK